MKSADVLIATVREASHCRLIDHGEDGLAFLMKVKNRVLRVIVGCGIGWDHVSVSLATRTPTWAEMEVVRKLVTLPGEWWIQYGVPAGEHVNNHPNVLHWWRPHDQHIPTPPRALV